MTENRPTDQQTDSGYEKHDVNVNKIVIYGVMTIILLAVMVVVMINVYNSVKEDVYYEVVLSPESAALRELRARETEELGSYQLLDAERRIYRIPIERAMRIMADEAYLEMMETPSGE